MFGSIDGRFCGVPLLYSIETMHTKDFCGPKDQTEISVTIFFFNWENITPKFILLIKVGPESWLWYSHLCRAYAHTHTHTHTWANAVTHMHTQTQTRASTWGQKNGSESCFHCMAVVWPWINDSTPVPQSPPLWVRNNDSTRLTTSQGGCKGEINKLLWTVLCA